MKEILDKLNFTELKTGSLGKTMSREREDSQSRRKRHLIKVLCNTYKEVLKLNKEKQKPTWSKIE